MSSMSRHRNWSTASWLVLLSIAHICAGFSQEDCVPNMSGPALKELDVDDDRAHPLVEVFGKRPLVTGKYAPAGGKLMLGVGQDLETVTNFVRDVIPNPSCTTTYTNIGNGTYSLSGLSYLIDYRAGPVFADAQLRVAPDSAIIVGLYMKDKLEEIGRGEYDEYIDQLGDWIKDTRRPVFLRIGYEFDGPWNAHDPRLFKHVWRRIVLKLRHRSVNNFVAVWQSATYPKRDVGYQPQRVTPSTYMSHHFTQWYPGDDYVDWMGTTYFQFDKAVHDEFLDFARAKDKPVMVAEAAPQGYDLETGRLLNVFTDQTLEENLSGRDIWARWYQPFFSHIYENRDVIRLVSYINTPWKSQGLWTSGENGYWGDSRVQIDPYIMEKFKKEILNTGLWILASQSMLNTLESTATHNRRSSSSPPKRRLLSQDSN